jgi:hypothetical protein
LKISPGVFQCPLVTALPPLQHMISGNWQHPGKYIHVFSIFKSCQYPLGNLWKNNSSFKKSPFSKIYFDISLSETASKFKLKFAGAYGTSEYECCIQIGYVADGVV